MNLLKKAKRDGLSLKSTFTFMLIISTVIAGILLMTTYDTIKSFHALTQATDAYINLEEAASSLLSASNYMTNEAQCYTVMGKREHLDNYFKEVTETRRRDLAVETMEKYLPDSQALLELKGAMQESNALMETEYYAMMLILSAQGDTNIPDLMKDVKLSEKDMKLSPEEKKDLAERMMHDEAYDARKNLIISHLSNCIDNLKTGTHGTQETTKAQLYKDLQLTTFMIVLQSLGIILILLLTTRLGINPLISAVEHIKRDQSLPIIGAHEFRYLAATYNKMYTAYKKSIENLSYQASHDSLTEIYNRAGYDLIKQSVDLKTTAFLLLDADNFKDVNDLKGHETGDLALKKIARTLKKHFRNDDYICRIGGDEFVVLMIHVDESIRPMIEKKVAEINKDLADTEDGLPPLSVSVGVSFCRDTNDVQQVFHEADTALYNVKDHGRKNVCFYIP